MDSTLMIAALLLLTTIGCVQSSTPPSPTKSSSAQNTPTAPQAASPADDTSRTVTDGLKRTVTLPRKPTRIVSLAPKNTEELFAIGAGDRVVGVTSYCNFPAEAAQREQIGGFSSKSISLEKIVSLQPDLVVSAGSFHAHVIAELERLKIPVVALAAESFDELFGELLMLGQLTGLESNAQGLVGRMRKRVQAIEGVSKNVPADQRASVFYMTWDDPLTAAGPASYAGKMIELCGATNIISDVTTQYPQISQEVLLDRDPAVILAANMTTKRWTVDSLRAKTGWQNLKALRQNRLYLLDGDAVSRCGPRLVEVLESMAYAIYPDRFPKPSNADAVTASAGFTQNLGQVPLLLARHKKGDRTLYRVYRLGADSNNYTIKGPVPFFVQSPHPGSERSP